VPLDPWRYYELGRVADGEISGRCLDVSSPKLLMSLLQHEGRGDWLGVDLFAGEIERWRHVDPALRLEVRDATRLGLPDASFDSCVCISVVEHVAGDGDAAAMGEMWRVLKPGGRLILTTNVATEPREFFRGDRIWGEASEVVGDKVFYERHYSPAQVDQRLLGRGWTVERREFAVERNRWVQDWFVALLPMSYLAGAWLRFLCPRNFLVSDSPSVLSPARHGVVYLELRKPEA